MNASNQHNSIELANFDRHGGRVGYGAGFYDIFLNKMNRKVDKIALRVKSKSLTNVVFVRLYWCAQRESNPRPSDLSTQ
ncbi:5-formyltetrahydrofolate cyclo-ligase [Clostridium estertheticum]|uniref:5-formyltetrahydrofolate cyclo-ligase n=1 Tax=Clostridium estertheticum TaxID=238834 RepID=UPI0013E97502